MPLLSFALGCSGAAQALTLDLEVRRRDAAGAPFMETISIEPRRTVMVVSDIWDRHWDVVMASRVDSVVPRVNDGLEVARKLGIRVLHAQADIPTPPDDAKIRRPVATLPDVPLPPFPGTGFFHPVVWPPYNNPFFSKMAPPRVRPSGQRRHEKVWTGPHRDLALDPDRDVWIDAEKWSYAINREAWSSSSRDLQELRNYTRAHDIETVIFCGGATNLSALYKGFGMMQAKRLGLRVLVATDMSFTYTGNGFDEHAERLDASISPDSGERRVNAWIERHFDGTFHTAQLLAHDPKFAYTARVSLQEGLVSYWRLDASSGGTHVQDVMRVQGAWSLGRGNRPGVTLGAPGAIAGDGDTAARFDGTNALLVSPMFRTDTPPGSPLRTVSAESFTVEAWVRPSRLAIPQAIISHDDGSDARSDFLLSIGDAAGAPRFRFATRGFANDLASTTRLAQTNDAEETWFHLAGVQDEGEGEVQLFVNGRLEARANLRGEPRSVASSLQIGSRGHPNADDGEAGEGNSGQVIDPGFALFHGLIDEVAIYKRALSAESIREHYLLGLGPAAPDTHQGD